MTDNLATILNSEIDRGNRNLKRDARNRRSITHDASIVVGGADFGVKMMASVRPNQLPECLLHSLLAIAPDYRKWIPNLGVWKILLRQCK
jgi:hypothetical protein